MFKFLKKDSFWLGLILGVLMPAICFGILYLLNNTVFVNPQKETDNKSIFSLSMIIILSIVPNAIALRLYLVNLKADKTGRGILIVTLIIAVAFMIFHYKYNM